MNSKKLTFTICGTVLILLIIALAFLFACGNKSGNTDKNEKTTPNITSTSTSATSATTTTTTAKISATSLTSTTTTISTTPTTPTTLTTTAVTTTTPTTPPSTTPTPPTTTEKVTPAPTQPPVTQPPETEPTVILYNKEETGNAYLDSVMKDWFNSKGYYVYSSLFLTGNTRSVCYSNVNRSISIGYWSLDGYSLTTDDTSRGIGVYGISVNNGGFDGVDDWHDLYSIKFEDSLLEFQSNPDILLDYLAPYI